MKKFDLICFDVDGTLVEHPSGRVIWEVLNLRIVGDDRVNSERYRLYHEGRISYEDWVRLDVSGWIEKGARREVVEDTAREFALLPGVEEALRGLKGRGYRLAVVSGTLDILIETLFPGHIFDAVFTNEIKFDESGRICGWRATPFDLYGKPVALELLAARYRTTLARTAFVGDGDNDVPVVGRAGVVVAFNPRSEELASKADIIIRDKDLKKLLDIFP